MSLASQWLFPWTKNEMSSDPWNAFHFLSGFNIGSISLAYSFNKSTQMGKNTLIGLNWNTDELGVARGSVLICMGPAAASISNAVKLGKCSQKGIIQKSKEFRRVEIMNLNYEWWHLNQMYSSKSILHVKYAIFQWFHVMFSLSVTVTRKRIMKR